MKTKIIAILTLLTATVAMAQQQVEGLSSMQRAIGYWPTDSITIDHVMIGEAGTYPVGAYITNRMLRSYAGCKVVGVRFALGESVGRTRAFVYKVDPENGTITEEPVTQNQRTYAGWNNVFFNAGKEFELDGTEELIVGYDYVETTDMVSADTGALCTVGMEEDEPDEGQLSGNEFLIYGNFGSGEGWFPITNVGMLCAQLILDVSSLPAKAVDMSYLDTGFRYKQPGESIDILTTVTNVGRENVSGYELYVQLDEQTPQPIASTRPLSAGGTETYQPTLRLPYDITVGKHTVRVGMRTVEGEAVEPTDRTVMEQQFYVYAHPLARQKVYVEQYTDQDEYIAEAVNTTLELVERDYANACYVNVYKPGNPLAIPESEDLARRYAYTYPCFTSNRAYFPAEDYIAYDVNYYVEMVGPEFVTGIVQGVLEQDYTFASFATIQMQPSYDFATHELTVDVTGTLSEDAVPIYGDVAVTLMITEDNVQSYQYYVNGRGRVVRNNNYLHRHVLRAFATAPDGDKVAVSGNTYSGRFTITLDDAWVPENLILVGLVTRYADHVTSDNLKEMDVTNADAMPLAAYVSGIREVTPAQTAADAPRYNLAGQRVGDHYRGIVVRQGKKYLSR